MRKFLLITAALALCATVALAATPQQATKGAPGATTGQSTQAPGKTAPHMHKVMNNITRTEANGDRTALCPCGMEFKVTDKTPVWENDGTTYYMCNDACRAATAKETAEELGRTMGTWREKFHEDNFASNAVEKDGKRSAACACGRNFEVTGASRGITENGVRMYCCSEACQANMMKMSSAERAAAEAKVGRGATK